MSKDRRAFIIVLDGVGAGASEDAAEYGDAGASTLASAARGNPKLDALCRLGIGNIEGLSFLGTVTSPAASYGRMREASRGKDTTTGHWEIAGLVSANPPPVYPQGFPPEIMAEFERRTGRKTLVNLPYSGTEIIRKYGEEARRTGSLIVYTSGDSVFQIAAHTEVIPIEELYRYCGMARQILCGKHAVGRVIARPYAGAAPDFYRTADRRDFSLEPFSATVLDAVKNAGREVVAVGKISDIFAARGITRALPVHGNPDCMRATDEVAATLQDGLCFVNLVDTDMQYGHRRDIPGFAAALSEFDLWLSGFIGKLREGDLLIITADHGCDPGFHGTDHTREFVPLLVYGKNTMPTLLGTRRSFSDIAASVAEWLGVPYRCPGVSFVREIEK